MFTLYTKNKFNIVLELKVKVKKLRLLGKNTLKHTYLQLGDLKNTFLDNTQTNNHTKIDNYTSSKFKTYVHKLQL